MPLGSVSDNALNGVARAAAGGGAKRLTRQTATSNLLAGGHIKQSHPDKKPAKLTVHSTTQSLSSMHTGRPQQPPMRPPAFAVFVDSVHEQLDDNTAADMQSENAFPLEVARAEQDHNVIHKLIKESAAAKSVSSPEDLKPMTSALGGPRSKPLTVTSVGNPAAMVQQNQVKRQPLVQITTASNGGKSDRVEDLDKHIAPPMQTPADVSPDELDKSAASSTDYGSAMEESIGGQTVDGDDENEQADVSSTVSSAYATARTTPGDQLENSILLASPYERDIYAYMRQREQSVRARPAYMRKQTDISAEMRGIMIDWFADVVAEYNLMQETLHLAVSLVDRLLSKFWIKRSNLQLVGTTAMMIASKYEEIYPPELKDFVYITDDTYTATNILNMERYMLKELDFAVSAPTASWFACRFAKLQNADRLTRHAMEYVLDLSLLDLAFLAFRPSLLAAAALCYANLLTGPDPWTKEMELVTEISLSEFSSQVLPLMHAAFSNAPNGKLQALYSRYSAPELDEVARLPPPTEIPTPEMTVTDTA